MNLTDKQWEVVVSHIPIQVRIKNRGRKRNDDRTILNGILWILRTGAPWKYLPKEYGSYQTCHRRFQEWVDNGIFAEILTALAKDMEERGKLDVSECFIDGTFSPAKKGSEIGLTKRGKGNKIMAIADRAGLPVSIILAAATPHEIRLVEETVAQRFTKKVPRLLVGDRAYDSDQLDGVLRQHRVRLVAPHKVNRIKPATQDGRELRRYKRRWKVERLNAWLQNFRKLVTRYEYKARNFLGFIHLAVILILLRNR